MTRKGLLSLGALVVVLVLAGGVFAQGDETLSLLEAASVPAREAPELAERLGGVEGATTITVPPSPDYNVGDRLSFYVGNDDEDRVFQIEAVLGAETPGVYMWVEDGVSYDADSLEQIARQFDDEIFPAIRAAFGEENNPGIDGDPHIYVLNATGLGMTVGGYFNDASTYPPEVIETSNAHEMFVVAVDNVPFQSSFYTYVLAHEFVHMIQNNEDPNDETWVSEGTAELGAFLAVESRTDLVDLYLSNPTIQLNGWDLDDSSPYYGAAALFFNYLIERYGEEATRIHSLEPANGIEGINRALEALQAVDPETGQQVTFDDVFADWLAANYLNDPSVGDGRFGYTMLLPRQATEQAFYNEYPVDLAGIQVRQFSGNYVRLESSTDQTLAIQFDGSETVQLVPAQPHSGEHFYWANRADQSDTRMTGTFDLSGVESATLNFWTWYELEDFWDYGYFSVSTDGGESWTVLETENTTDENPNSRAFAAGITGLSGGGEERPAPYLGIRYDQGTAAVVEIASGGPADAGGIQVNDQLVAINGETFTPANLTNVLDQHLAGETVTITVMRDGEEVELEVTLGENPQRILAAAAEWIEESLDLTPFVGGEVMVRFEYVTDQAYTRNGWLIDDISIPEIGYTDDAESDSGGWTLEGWVRVTNELPQEFLVEVIQGGSEPAVTRLLMPDEGTQGEWAVEVGPDTPATLAISGMTPYTTEMATFDLSITAE